MDGTVADRGRTSLAKGFAAMPDGPAFAAVQNPASTEWASAMVTDSARPSWRYVRISVAALGAGDGVVVRVSYVLWDPDQIDDDVLALMFISCHPVLSRDARVALTLRVVGGLTSDEVAKVFLVPTASVQARITRAKKTLAAARVPFTVPPPEGRTERLGSVLSVVYLIFTEGASASSGTDLIRFDLAGEAQRLARVLTRLVPNRPEVHGLLALRELTAARFPARTDRTASRCCWNTRTAAAGTAPRSAGAEPPWPARSRSAEVWAPTACSRQSPNAMPSLRRWT